MGYAIKFSLEPSVSGFDRLTENSIFERFATARLREEMVMDKKLLRLVDNRFDSHFKT